MNTTIIPEADTDDDALAMIERTHRPSWATSEGEYDYETIYYKRWMTHRTVCIDQFLNRHPLDWRFDRPADINIREDEGVMPDRARLIIADIAEAVAILEAAA